MDLGARAIHGPAGRIVLSQREWAIFEALLQRPGSIVTRPQLEERLYAFDAAVESNTIEVNVSRTRKKLGRASIKALRGIGYRPGHPGGGPMKSLRRDPSPGLAGWIVALWLAALTLAGGGWTLPRRCQGGRTAFGRSSHRTAGGPQLIVL